MSGIVTYVTPFDHDDIENVGDNVDDDTYGIRKGNDGNGDNVGYEDDGDGGEDGVDDGRHQVDVVVLGQQAADLGAALVYVDYLAIIINVSSKNCKNLLTYQIHISTYHDLTVVNWLVLVL